MFNNTVCVKLYASEIFCMPKIIIFCVKGSKITHNALKFRSIHQSIFF